MKDLVLLVADKNAQFALKGALERPEALGITPIEFEFRVHPGRDGGVRKFGVDMLALERRRFKHALLVMDYEGSGSALSGARALEDVLNEKLRTCWNNAARAIVIEPELDAWVWGSDNSIKSAIDWSKDIGIRDWLRNQGFHFELNDKPSRPKEAFEAALKTSGSPRSSALYQHIASKISLQKCRDEAFGILRGQLHKWFSV